MACDRDSQSMEFIERNGFHGAGFSVRENYGLSNELRFRSLERMQNRCCAELGTWHGRSRCVRGSFEFSIPTAMSWRSRSAIGFFHDLLSHRLQFRLRHLFNPDQILTRGRSPDQLVQLQRSAISVLRILD